MAYRWTFNKDLRKLENIYEQSTIKNDVIDYGVTMDFQKNDVIDYGVTMM